MFPLSELPAYRVLGLARGSHLGDAVAFFLYLGTVLAFMMSVIGLSLPEVVILRKVLRPPLIAAFVGVVASGILLVGFLFNAIM